MVRMTLIIVGIIIIVLGALGLIIGLEVQATWSEVLLIIVGVVALLMAIVKKK